MDSDHSGDTADPQESAQEFLEENRQSGEISGFKMGDAYHLVYKAESSTFEEPAHLLWGVMDNSGAYVYPLERKESLETLYAFLSQEELTDSENLYYLNEDVFLLGYRHGSRQNVQVAFYDARTNEIAYLTVRQDVNSNIWQELNMVKVLTGFNDGLIATELSCGTGYHQTEYRAVLLDRTGQMTEPGPVYDGSSKAFRTDGTNSVGAYADGLFWAYGSFYDRDGNQVIDLSEYQVENIPAFEDGQAQLEIRRNGKLWSACIDKSGAWIGEPVEMAS